MNVNVEHTSKNRALELPTLQLQRGEGTSKEWKDATFEMTKNLLQRRSKRKKGHQGEEDGWDVRGQRR